MKLRYLGMVAAVALLAACANNPSTTTGGQTSTGTTTAPSGGQMSTSSTTPGSQADFVQNVGDRVFFDLNHSDLRPDAVKELQQWVVFLKKYPNDHLTIEGHCDERGTREYNLALGDRRANAVKNYLVAQGVSAANIKTISYGKERPAVLGHDEAAWAQNRRGVGVIN